MNNLSYESRIAHTQNVIAKKILQTIADKKSNLCLSADVNNSEELLSLVEKLGPYICMIKTHIDIIDDFTPSLTKKLRQLADQENFIIFEDRKFADIGNTVKMQFQNSIYRIADWADIINAHALPGPGILKGLQDAKGILLLAEMSSEGHLFSAEYQKSTLQMANQYQDLVIGFITQHALENNPAWIYLTPGVSLQTNNDALGQQYISPQTAIHEKGNDIIIVGRSIIKANDPVLEAIKYRDAGWKAYLSRLR